MRDTGEEALRAIQAIPGNDFALRGLAEQLRSGVGVVPFVGTGFSIPFGFPGWGGFLLELARRAGISSQVKRRLKAGQFEEAAEDLLQALKHRAFHDRVRDAFGAHRLEGKTLAGVVSHVVRLAAGPVVTTNLDHVLERVFENALTPFDDVALGARAERIIQAFHANRRFLLKIHGDANEATDRILTLGDYRRQYGGDDASSIDWKLPLPRLLALMLMSRPCLFLGCSLDRDRTTEVLGHIARRYPEMAHYAVVEQSRLSKARREKAQYLSERGIRPIRYPPGRHDLIEPLLAWLVKQGGVGRPPELGRGPVNRLLSGPSDPLLQHRTGFFGRSVEVEGVVKFLVAGRGIATVSAAAEVCNVRGAPGIGKTEICKQALKEYLTAHPERPAYYVQLAEAKDERGFLARLAEAFGAGAAVNRQQVLDAVAARPGLIYLDNLEDVVADQGSRELLAALAGVPSVMVLASSRETLPGLGSNIPIHRLPEDAAAQLFLQEWERSGASVSLADSAELREFLRQARELYRREREPVGLAYACAELARTAQATGEADEARGFISEALRAAAASHAPTVAEYVAAGAQEIGLTGLPG